MAFFPIEVLVTFLGDSGHRRPVMGEIPVEPGSHARFSPKSWSWGFENLYPSTVLSISYTPLSAWRGICTSLSLNGGVIWP
jgi:hypothetical protein